MAEEKKRCGTHHPPQALSVSASKLGDNGIWLAGAWGSYGFHEDGLNSALRVVNGMGIGAPWQTMTPSLLAETESA